MTVQEMNKQLSEAAGELVYVICADETQGMGIFSGYDILPEWAYVIATSGNQKGKSPAYRLRTFERVLPQLLTWIKEIRGDYSSVSEAEVETEKLKHIPDIV